MCTLALSRQQVTTHQQRVNHGSVPFPSPSYSAMPLKFAAFSDNCQPHVDNESAVSVIPEQPLNRADTQLQLNGSWSGNVHGNSEPLSASTILMQPHSLTHPQPVHANHSAQQPSQPPQLVQPAQPIGAGSATTKKCHCVYVPDTYQDQAGKEK